MGLLIDPTRPQPTPTTETCIPSPKDRWIIVPTSGELAFKDSLMLRPSTKLISQVEQRQLRYDAFWDLQDLRQEYSRKSQVAVAGRKVQMQVSEAFAKHASVSLASDESIMVSFVTRPDVSHTGETTGRSVRGFKRVARVAAIARLRQRGAQRARRPRSAEACCIPHQAIFRIDVLVFVVIDQCVSLPEGSRQTLMSWCIQGRDALRLRARRRQHVARRRGRG